MFGSLGSMTRHSVPTLAARPTAALNPTPLTGWIRGTYYQGKYDIAAHVRGIGWLSSLGSVGASGFVWLRGPLCGADLTLISSRTTSVVFRIRDRLRPSGHTATVQYTSIHGLWADSAGSGNVEITLTGTRTRGKFTAIFT
jgi:hypothetical protein